MVEESAVQGLYSIFKNSEVKIASINSTMNVSVAVHALKLGKTTLDVKSIRVLTLPIKHITIIILWHDLSVKHQ